MEKILIGPYGEAMSFDTETNRAIRVENDIYVDKLVKATSDGQILTETEVIDVKAGEYIMTMHSYVDSKCITKAIVISDSSAIYDLDEWQKLLDLRERQVKEQTNSDRNETR